MFVAKFFLRPWQELALALKERLFSPAVFAAIFFLLPSSVSAISPASFSDVALTSEHFAAIEYLKSKGVISGYADHTFQPQKSINRAEALKMLALAAKFPPDTPLPAKAPFSDLKKKDWFYLPVGQAYGLGIVQGYSDHTFRPNLTVNLAESLKMLLKSFGTVLQSGSNGNPYPDVDKTAWYSVYAEYAKSKKLVVPEDDGRLHAEKKMSREDFAQIVYRLMTLQEEKLQEFPLNRDWPSFSHKTDHYALKFPFDWQKIEADRQMVFWKQDTFNGQVSFSRIFPDSAAVFVAVDENPGKLMLDNYFKKIQYDPKAEIQKQTWNGYASITVSVAQNGLKDFYFELPNGMILIAYSQTGDGLLKPYLEDEIHAIVDSIRYVEATETRESLLTQIRANILVAKKGQAMLNLLPDRIIIETDTIGIGTGPVDYYYSLKYDVTLKYERNFDTLLALKEAKTSAF